MPRFAVALLIGVCALEVATAAGAATPTRGTLDALEQPSAPKLCAAVRATGSDAADRLNAISADVAVKTKETLDASRTESSVRQCVSALSNLGLGLDVNLRYPNVNTLLSRVVDRACQFANQRINDEVLGLRSRFSAPGGYFGVQGDVTRGVGDVDVNTHDSSTYAANCVWDWLNGRPTRCR